MSHIIGPDQNAQKVWLHIDGIFLPAVAEIGHGVTAHPSIVKIQLGLGHIDA